MLLQSQYRAFELFVQNSPGEMQKTELDPIKRLGSMFSVDCSVKLWQSWISTVHTV